jgi:glutathione synthase/RimK-type ligase-like ATP-grasp enzyme
MKIGIILYRRNPVITETIENLREHGADVELIEPGLMSFELSDLRVRHDLYVIKSIAMPMSMSVAAALHALGATTFNPFPIVQRIRNKIVTLRLLADHGVPVPSTYVTAEAETLVPLLDHGPLIVKPYMGSRGFGVKRVTTRDELMLAISAPPILGAPPIVAQRFHPSDDGLDHKISVIGGKVFGVKRRFPLRTYSDKIGTPLEIDDETRDIAVRISKALPLDTFTFDLMVSGGKPYVVDVGAFGSLMGVPGAPALVTARIIQAWEERPQ